MLNESIPVNIKIEGDLISEVSSFSANRKSNPQINFDRALVFPGLINSHDHLDFNLFPKLGNKTYNNYNEWGAYIHGNFKKEIDAVLKIPKDLRSLWGIYKNLLCGVTTVVNHGEKCGNHPDLLTVFEGTHCLHSVKLEKYWKLKMNNPFKINQPVNIHSGEGKDMSSKEEINELIRWNLFHKKMIGVHAVAMTAAQAAKFEAIVWCPETNYFLLNKTADIAILKNHTSILFGTDSALTGSWNFWEHLRLARKTKLLNDSLLFDSFTIKAAQTWNLNTGKINRGSNADLIVAKMKNGDTYFDSFFSLSPADLLLVVHKGKINLFDESVLPQLKGEDLTVFSKISIFGSCKYVKGDLPGLMKKINTYHPKINFGEYNLQHFI